MITRLPVVDDTGDGTSGTAITAAWWAQVCDMIDGRWSIHTNTSAGNVNDYVTNEADMVFCANPTALSIQGIVAPAAPLKPGKTIRIVPGVNSLAAVSFVHVSAACAPVNRMVLHFEGRGLTLSALGSATFVYTDALGGCWWLVAMTGGTFT